MIKINQLIINKLIKLNLTISLCESMTGGLVASNFVSAEKASNCFLGSFVTYSAQSKIKMAGVSEQIIKDYGTISKECALAMAKGTQKKFNSDIAISITGNASVENPAENKRSGIAYICILIFDKKFEFEFVTDSQTRNDIRNECTAHILNKFWNLIKDLRE